MRIGLAALGICAIAAALSGPVNAANVTSFDPNTIVQALHDAGFKGALGKADSGDPVIETASDGETIQIALTDCTDHRSCGTSEFVGVWDCGDAIDKCKAAAADVNSEENPVHIVFLDNGKTAVTYAYLLFDEVGISENLFIKNLMTFTHYNSRFADAVVKKVKG